MESEACARLLQSFIGQIVDYHRRCNFQHAGPIVLTFRMATFALPECSVEEVAGSIKSLAAKGAINILKEEPLCFTPRASWGHT